jgi:two-component system, NtrC family, sensor kinase
MSSIRDTGHGIPDEHLGRIFDPFFTTKDVGRGTGIGLAVCSQIIHAHGGKIVVQSQLGVGSTFTIRLPIAHGG